MLAFILRRAIQAIGVMVVVGVLSFSMFRFAGDPVNQMVSIDTSAEQRAAIRHSLGLDDPVLVQFARYFAHAAEQRRPSKAVREGRAQNQILQIDDDGE